MAFTQADYQDMQGLLRFGYGALTEACFLLLRIEDAAAAGLWLEGAPMATAEVQIPPPAQALQLAFTCEGLRKLRVAEETVNGFSAEFLSGMAGDENRSRRLGDIGESAPQHWQWGGPGNVPDMVAMIYARPGQLEAWKLSLEDGLKASGFVLLQCLPTTDMGGVEPFGFVDGVSQPQLDWEGRRGASGDKLTYENLCALGEFVLGYPNEYGKNTGRPLISKQQAADLPDAVDAAGHADLGRNGTYMVLRQLEQDVRGFWRFADAQTNSDEAARLDLAEKMVGRRITGDPLLHARAQAITVGGTSADDARLNDFTYDEDRDGTMSPMGAHVRRANPRNSDFSAGTHGLWSKLVHMTGFGRTSMREDIIASTRFHRLLRRGREYGSKLTAEQRLEQAPPDAVVTGLQFACLNANIARQFEFVQNAWLMGSKFDGLNDESDPLLGNREQVAGCPVDKFSVPSAHGVRKQIQNVPRFITVRGGAYFFLPGVRALRYIARAARI